MAEVDVGAILDTVTPIVVSAIKTAGTKADVFRGGMPGRVDPETLVEVGGTPGDPIHDDLDCIVRPASARSTGGDPFPARVARTPQDYSVMFLPEVIDIHEGDVVVVTASRDPRQLLAAYRLSTVEDGTPGLVRQCIGKQIARGITK